MARFGFFIRAACPDAARSSAKIADLIFTLFETRGCLLTIAVASGRVLSPQEVSSTFRVF